MAPRLHLIGQRFNRLLVIGEAPNYVSAKGQRHAQWLCRCDCGEEVVIRGSDLRAGRTQSCGCWNSAVLVRRNWKHGATVRGKRNRAYQSWTGMKSRCSDPNSADWQHYGGRGIKVCTEWEDFTRFLADMGEPPPGHSLERIDVNGDYCPANCMWATAEQQAQNKRRALTVSIDGVPVPLRIVANVTGINYGTLRHRLHAGWPLDRLLGRKLSEPET